MTNGVRTPQPTVILYGGGVALASDPSGEVRAEEAHGLFAGDTRMLSTYRIEINGSRWQLLGRSRLGHGTARWEFQNPSLRDPSGDIEEGMLLFSLRRRVDGALHDDLTLRAFTPRAVRLRLTLQLDADFADIFEVKSESLPPRMNALRTPNKQGITLVYERGEFRRRLHVHFIPSGTPPIIVSSRVIFEIDLEPEAAWRCCVETIPEIDGRLLPVTDDLHEPESEPATRLSALAIRSDAILEHPFNRGQADLHALVIPQPGHPPLVAAGAPWFLALFGRDSLVTALMAGIDGSWIAEGALAALSKWQGTKRDDFRDEEPGKIPHELRHGELTRRGVLPYSPYYGTHDAPALYCLALWQAWRWTGKRSLLDAYLDTARKALQWCDEYGDQEGDGFQEYVTRSPKGYRNQGWKDAGDAIVHGDGTQPEPPLATVELQGYLFAARLAMAELLTERGHMRDAARMRSAAVRLQQAVEGRFWMPQHRFYAFALDRDKRLVDGIASNPGHLLWTGLPNPERAALVAKRLLEPDLFSGWGLRTLSSDNPAYNPLSYQLGSVWPHDTAIAAAGMWRYGLREEASTLLHAILNAATAFEEDRLPELFCGLDDACGFPVPYEKANSPQAWAAAVPLLAVQLFLGLVPDAPRQRCFLAPWLPAWLPRLEVRGIAIGGGRIDITVVRCDDKTEIEKLSATDISVVHETAESPLWGIPPRPMS